MLTKRRPIVLFPVKSACLLVSAVCLISACSAPKPKITVGAKSGADQTILGEILAQHIETRTGMEVTRRTGVGSTPIVHQALLMSDIDLYAENVGALMTNVLKEPLVADPAVTLQRVRTELDRIAKVILIGPVGLENPYVLVIRASEARARKITTISDASAVPKPGWSLAASADFQARPDGMQALQGGYDIPTKAVPSTRETLEAYQLLRDGHVSMVVGNATDGALASQDLLALIDDKKAFPPAQVCVLTRADVVQRRPDLPALIMELKGKLSATALSKLAFENETKNRPIKELAAGFLAGMK